MVVSRFLLPTLIVWGLAASSGAADATKRELANLRSPAASVRARAAKALGQQARPESVPSLVTALSDTDSRVRLEAAKALGSIKSPTATPDLVAALRDKETNVRVYAAYSLGEIKDRQSAGALLEALSDPEYCVRDQAAWALRELRSPELAAPLTAALQKQGADVAHIMWVLQGLGTPVAIQTLKPLLSAPQVDTRLTAVAGLASLKDEAAVEPLIASLSDADAGVRKSALEALSAHTGDRLAVPLRQLLDREQDTDVRKSAEALLLKVDPPVVPIAWWSLDDRNTTVARDITGNGNQGEIKGCQPSPGKLGSGLTFGKGRFIELGKPAGLPIANAPMTIMAWAHSKTNDGVIVGRGGAFCGYSLYLKDGLPKFGIHRTQEEEAIIAVGKEPVAGRWVHLAGVVKADRIELYVDGKLAASAKSPGFIPGNCGQGMEIGFDVGNSAVEITTAFEGVIDEVKQFAAALSEQQVAEHSRAAAAQ